MQDKKNGEKNKDLPLVVGIDPATGARSALGFSIFDPNTEKILLAKEISNPSKDLRTRIKSIVVQLVKEFKRLDENACNYVVFIESTVMLGKGGESLQRVIGAIMTIIPAGIQMEHVSNMQIKAFVGGTGKADKNQVAMGLINFFPEDPLLIDLIKAHRYDVLDSIAVGVTGLEKFILKTNIKKNNRK